MLSAIGSPAFFVPGGLTYVWTSQWAMRSYTSSEHSVVSGTLSQSVPSSSSSCAENSSKMRLVFSPDCSHPLESPPGVIEAMCRGDTEFRTARGPDRRV